MEDDEFFYYLRNKKKKTKCHKEQKDLFFIFFIFIWKWNDEEIKKTSQEDKNTWFTNFKLQDPYENLNLTNHTYERS